MSGDRRRVRKSALQSPSRREADRRCRPIAALAVETWVRRIDGQSADSKRVQLAGLTKPGRRRGRSVVPSVQDQEMAARRIARGVRPEDVARLLAALAHLQRVEILLKLLGGEATHRSLAKATGLKAGPLYHHLRELRMAGLIGPKVRDLYVLTAKGGRAVLAGLALERLCR